MTLIKSYYKSFKFIYSLFIYNEDKPPTMDIEINTYPGIDNESTPTPVKIIFPIQKTNKVVILYPGASQAAEEHPKMDMLGRLLAKIGFKVYIPRIPPLKKLNISDEQIKELINKPYIELSSALRYEIETSNIQKTDLL